MSSIDYAITFACYNQVSYTRQCVDSMIRHGVDLSRVIAVDNSSKDETRTYLDSLPLGGKIYNKDNFGCGIAWNQGALALQAEWTIVMNNDVLVSANWIENMIQTAEREKLKIVCPAMIEGPLDYDFESFSRDAQNTVGKVLRLSGRHAVCLAVHHSVWMDIGYFQPVPKLLGYEDTLFFNEVDKAGIRIGITGSSWLHHFGSVTQTAMKQERGLSQKDGLGYRYNYRLLQQSWIERKLRKAARKNQSRQWRDDECKKYGISLHGLRENQTFRWI